MSQGQLKFSMSKLDLSSLYSSQFVLNPFSFILSFCVLTSLRAMSPAQECKLKVTSLDSSWPQPSCVTLTNLPSKFSHTCVSPPASEWACRSLHTFRWPPDFPGGLGLWPRLWLLPCYGAHLSEGDCVVPSCSQPLGMVHGLQAGV